MQGGGHVRKFPKDDVRMCHRRKGAPTRTCHHVLGPSREDLGRLVGNPKLATENAFMWAVDGLVSASKDACRAGMN